MSDAEIDAMEAGSMIDRLVMGAIGPVSDEQIAKACYCDQPCPSADWVDAMFAAERLRLFAATGHDAHLHSVDDLEDGVVSWHVSVLDRESLDCGSCDDKYEVDIASANSGPLAICRAILRLARKE